jgi:hypothetical protein
VGFIGFEVTAIQARELAGDKKTDKVDLKDNLLSLGR